MMRKLFKKERSFEKGSALITLLFFSVMAITIITSATLVLSSNLLSTSAGERGLAAYYAAESGAENGLLTLLREPSFSGTLPAFQVGDAQATVVIDHGIITSSGTYGDLTRRIEVRTASSAGVLNVSSWREI